MKIYEAIAKATGILNENNIEDAGFKARGLMTSYLNMTKEQLASNIQEEDNFDLYFEQIQKLANNTPLEYITNNVYFMGYNFFVNENTLIPRIDSEIIVIEALKVIKSKLNNTIQEKIVENNSDEKLIEFNILEIGVGTGVLSLTIMNMLNTDNELENLTKLNNIQINLNILGVDISPKALEVANTNLNNHILELEKNNNIRNVNIVNNIKFIESDCYSNVGSEINNLTNNSKNYFDIIISNPPYINSNEIQNLNEDVKKEPILALDGGIDGMDIYNKILLDAKQYLKDTGVIVFEIGYDQEEKIKVASNNYNFNSCEVILDFENRPRVAIIK